MPYLYHTEDDHKAMLERLGVASVDELFDQIPKHLLLDGLLPIGEGKTEPETQRLFAELSAKNNAAAGMISFLGGGIYDHFVPSVVRNLTSRPEFVTAFEKMANLATRIGVEGQENQEPAIRIRTPLIAMTKAQIIQRGLELGVDYGITHSCYDPAPDGRSCGKCDSCQLRLKGFQEAGAVDPVEYVE